MSPYRVELPETVAQALGQLIVQWAHLDATLTTHARILLGEPRAREIQKFPVHLRIDLIRRVNLYRDLIAVLYNDEEKERTSKALDTICNVRVTREHLIHGQITPQDDGRLLIHFVEERQDGSLAGSNHWYTLERIEKAAQQMAQADGDLGESFRSYCAR